MLIIVLLQSSIQAILFELVLLLSILFCNPRLFFIIVRDALFEKISLFVFIFKLRLNAILKILFITGTIFWAVHLIFPLQPPFSILLPELVSINELIQFLICMDFAADAIVKGEVNAVPVTALHFKQAHPRVINLPSVDSFPLLFRYGVHVLHIEHIHIHHGKEEQNSITCEGVDLEAVDKEKCDGHDDEED